MQAYLKKYLAICIFVAICAGIVSMIFAGVVGDEIFFFGDQLELLKRNSIILYSFGCALFLFSLLGILIIMKNARSYVKVFNCGICWIAVAFAAFFFVVLVERMLNGFIENFRPSSTTKFHINHWLKAPYYVTAEAGKTLCSPQCACNWVSTKNQSNYNYSPSGAKKVQECPNFQANDDDLKWEQIEEEYHCAGIYEEASHYLFTDDNEQGLQGTCDLIFNDKLSQYFGTMILMLIVVSLFLCLNCCCSFKVWWRIPKDSEKRGEDRYVVIQS